MDSAAAGQAALASLCALLPAIDSLAELKVILCLLDAAAPLGRGDICARTGLSVGSVRCGLRRALGRGLACRLPAGRTFVYLAAAMDTNFDPSCMHDTCHTHHQDKQSSCNMHDRDAATKRNHLLRALVDEFGVSLRVATHLVETRDPAHIETHIGYARHAQAAGLIRRNPAGWVVASIRDSWAPPKGYASPAHPAQRWYSDEEYEQFFVHPAADHKSQMTNGK